MHGFDVESLIQIQCTIMYGCDSCLERCRTLNKVHRNFPFFISSRYFSVRNSIFFNRVPSASETATSGQPGSRCNLPFDTPRFSNVNCLLPSPLDVHCLCRALHHDGNVTIQNFHRCQPPSHPLAPCCCH